MSDACTGMAEGSLHSELLGDSLGILQMHGWLMVAAAGLGRSRILDQHPLACAM